MATSILTVSSYSKRCLPTHRPTKETSLAEFRKSQIIGVAKPSKSKTTTCGSPNKTSLIRRHHGMRNPNLSKSPQSNQSGKGILFKPSPSQRARNNDHNTHHDPVKPPTPSPSRRSKRRPSTAHNVNERRVSDTNSVFKQYRHPLRVDGHLPQSYKRYNLQGRLISKKEMNQTIDVDSVFVDHKINPNDLQVKPNTHYPEENDLIRIKKKVPSTGWIHVHPGEIGKVLDTGHVTVKAIFPSGLGIPWNGEVEDVEVMMYKPDVKQHVVGSKVMNRLRGIPETRYRGRQSVGSFYGPGFYAARKRGGGMVRARITIPHQYIGGCGFIIPNYVVSVDAVNYNDDDGCTMYVTMKPGDEQDLIPVVAAHTKNTGTVTITPKQYSAGWAYYPSTSTNEDTTKEDTATQNSNNRDRKHNKSNVSHPTPPLVVAVEQSILSEAASEAYHIDFTGTHHMSMAEKQKLMRRLCKQCQSGRIRLLRPVLNVSPEVVEWTNDRGRGRTLLHYAGLGGSLNVAKWLLRTGASTDARDDDQARPIDLVETYMNRYLVEDNGGGDGGGGGGRRKVDPHALKRYRMCRALLSTTTIHTAAKQGDVDRVSFLIREHIDLLNARNTYGMTPLHYGAMSGHLHVCQVLSHAGADWNAVNNVQQTPRDVARPFPEIVNLLPQKIRDEQLLMQAEEFARLIQQNKDQQSMKERKSAMQWVRGTSAASVIREEDERSPVHGGRGRGGGVSGRGRGRGRGDVSKLSTLSSLPGGSSYLNTSNNHNDLFYMAGTGLDRGGSALSALPEYGSSAYGPQRNSPNPYMSQWQGSSQHRSSTKTIGSRFSSLLQSSTFEEASMNFKGKSCWWNKNNNKRFKKTKKLPNTSSREFEKSMRDRYGHVKV